MAAVPKQVSVDAAAASVLSELEIISLLKEAQRTTLRADFDKFDLTSGSASRFVDLIGSS